MKRVGIMTFQYAYNFGAMMQAYALKRTVEDLTGYEVELINYKPAKYVQGDEDCRSPKYLEQRKKLDAFSKKYHGIETAPTSNIADIPQYDYYITGSDQVWNPMVPIRERTSEYFLDFVPNDKVKIAYAASVAQKVTEENELSLFRENIPRFDFLSVREQSFCSFIESFTDKKCYGVFDPTLLLDSSQYEHMLPLRECNKDYTLGVIYSKKVKAKAHDIINRYTVKHSQSVVNMMREITPYTFLNEEESIFYSGIEEMLWAIKNAKMVVTDSFHFMVFSIIFHKPFWAIVDGPRASRLKDLLSYLQLEDRIFNDVMTLEDLDKEIDYEKVDALLKGKREYSLNFLKEALT